MTAIFDMDGLLLDTEPLWGKSMLKVTSQYQIPVFPEHFKFTTGLRIYEVTEYWSKKFPWDAKIGHEQLAEEILEEIIFLSKTEGKVMDGALDCLEWLQSQDIKIGLATSSPMRMVELLIPHFELSSFFDVLTSADTALAGKPHPEVYLQCAHALNEDPWNCVAFEDSINGMISAKAARMKAVVVPEQAKLSDKRFGLADAVLPSLKAFTPDIWEQLANN